HYILPAPSRIWATFLTDYVIGEIGVSARYPRGVAFRTSEAYGGYCRAASEKLLSAIGANEHL
ncbi:MAG: hypothetical protein ACOVOI_05065, partial [Hyphomicrobiales bacterium]